MASRDKDYSSDNESKPTWKKKMKSIFKIVYAGLSSTVGLILVLICYTFIGAAIFMTIERPKELARRQELADAKDNVTLSIQHILELGSQNKDKNWTQKLEKSLKEYEDALMNQYGINPESQGHVWDFWGAFLFCATIYTTIGYGHIAPSDYAGQIATMLYAILGVPLCLVVMANVGKLFTRLLKWLWVRIPGVRKVHKLVIQHRSKSSSPERQEIKKSENERQESKKRENSIEPEIEAEHVDEVEGSPVFLVDDNFNLPPLVAIAVVVVYIAMGAGLYLLWEDDWGYLEAFYFIFISISTIGFGDILPHHPRYFLASSLYILFGLSLVAMVVNVIMEKVYETFHKAKEEIEHKVAKAISLQSIDKQSTEKLNSRSSSKENV